MLKKVLSGVLSLSIAGTMFASVPAFADSRKVENVASIINEGFDAAEVAAPQSDGIGSVGNNIKFKGYKYDDTTRNVSIDTSSDTKYLKTIFHKGGSQRLGIVPDSPVKLNQGDGLHISFDFKQKESKRLLLLIGDNYNTASGWTDGSKDAPGYTDTTTNNDMLFTPINNSFSGRWVANDAGNSTSNAAQWSQGFRRALAVWGSANEKANSVGIGSSIGEYVKDGIMDGDKWVNIDIKINTADATQDGKQTIKIKYTFDDNTTKEYYGILDAKYDGTSDTTTDVINTVNYLVIVPYWQDEVDVEFSMDNVLIEKTSYHDEYYTSTVKHLIDYDFSNESVRSYSKDYGYSWGSAIDTVDADNGVYLRKAYGPGVKGTVVKDSIDGKEVYAFKQEIKGRANTSQDANDGDPGDSMLIFMNPEGTTRLEKGDIIRFSYDAKNVISDGLTSVDRWMYRYSPTLNLPRTKHNGWKADTDNNPIDVEMGVYHLGVDGQDISKPDFSEGYGMLLATDCLGYTRYAAVDRYDGINNDKEIEQGEWHHYEFVINTADEAKDGKQSMKIYIDGDQTFYNVLDVNIEKDDVYEYTEFTALEMNTHTNKTEGTLGAIYSTNYKLDIIKPGFGIDGNAIKDNNPTDEITLNPGTMTVTCAVNLPGSAAKKDEVGTKDVTIFAAQYSDNCLIGIDKKTVKMSEYNNITSFECEVKTGADKVKLFAFDDNMKPLLVNETGIVTNGTDAQAIDYSNSFATAVD